MIKKCVTLWLATIICFILVPNAEASEWTLDLGKKAAESLTRDYTTLPLKGTEGSSTVEAELGEYTLLVFGRYNCFNTATTSRDGKAVHDDLGFTKGTVILMDIEHSYETIKEQQSNFEGVYLSTMDVTSSSLYNTCYWEITKACTALGSGSGVLPAMVLLDSKGNPVYCSTNYETSKSLYLTHMNDLVGTAETVPVTSVTISDDAFGIVVGDFSIAKASITPENASNQTVIWSSSDPTIAKVNDSGGVFGLKAGKVTITATSLSGNKSDSVTYTISDEAIPVTGISLENTDITLELGEIITVTPTVSPSNTTTGKYTWLTQNTSVLDSISFGVFEAKKAGVATITAQTSDGQFKASCTVTVVDNTLPSTAVTGIHLDKSSLSLNVGESSTLNAIISPETAVNQRVSWSSSAPSIASVNDVGVVTGKSGGTAVITATSSDGSFKATASVTVTGTTTGTTTSSTFADVSEGDWFESFVVEGVSKGYFSGYEDGTFRPHNNITIGEFYTMLCRYWGYDGLATELTHWSSEFARTMESLCWIDEIPSDLDKAITRVQVAEVVLRSVGAIPDFGAVNPYSDTENLSAITLYDMGVMEGWLDEYGTRLLSPDNNISRAEFATVLFSLEHYMNEVSGVTDFRFRREQLLEPTNPSFTSEYFEAVFAYMYNNSITEYDIVFENAVFDQLGQNDVVDLSTDAFIKMKDQYSSLGAFFPYVNRSYWSGGDDFMFTITLGNTNFETETMLEYQDIYLLQMGYWAQELVDQGSVKASDSDYDKAHFLYGYCAENFAYDTAINAISTTGYGLVANGIGVCQAYVSVYNALCSIYGIDIYGVSGIAGGLHIWSYANLDGEWLYIDPTFGDPIPNRDYANYDYFALTRDKIEETHTFDKYW